MQCLLCHSETEASVDSTFDCPHCRLKFKDPKNFLTHEEEHSRYSTHENNPSDQGYRDFLSRLLKPLTTFLPQHEFRSLDFGCGPGPTLSLLLKELGATTHNYDLHFFLDEKLISNQKYDVVTSTEVVEHFTDPKANWQLLANLTADSGLLGIMTQFLKPETNYSTWWYKNDPTHVVFYRPETFDYLASTLNLEKIYTDNNSIVIFRKKG